MVGKIPYPFLAGQVYQKTLTICKKLEYASRQTLHDFQSKVLSDILRFATNEVPAYKKYRSVVERLSPFEALKNFPLLTKETLQQNINDYVPDCINKLSYHKAYTGGSSGNQLEFNEGDDAYSVEMAFMHQQWKRVGYNPAQKKATFRGVSFKEIQDSSYWQENPIHNEIQFSPFHINPATINRYIDQLIVYRPVYLHGYPSAIDMLAKYILRQQISDKLPPIRAVLLGSEACSPIQRERIERAFNTKVFSWYGHSERLILGGECENNKTFHHFPAYGFLEMIKPDNTNCLAGEKGELVGTTFWNRSMPLIRYRTGDHAILEEPVCACRRQWDRFSNVHGRWNIEGVIGKNGSRVSAAALNMHGNLYTNVIRFQYFQNRIGKLEIRILPSPKFSKQDEQLILNEHNKKLWGELEISIKIVSDIPLTQSGKHLRIIKTIK